MAASASLSKQASAHSLQVLANLGRAFLACRVCLLENRFRLGFCGFGNKVHKITSGFLQIELTSSLIPICQLPNVLPPGFVPSIHLQICCFSPWLESSIVILILFELQSSPRRNLNPSFNSTCRKKQWQGKFLCSGLLCTWRDRRTELVV